MPNFWEEKLEFWRNKTVENPLYELQRKEAADDINRIIELHGIKRVLDIGGYQGEMKNRLEHDVEYVNLDFYTKFDLTKSWFQQGLSAKPNIQTLAYTSLVMLVLPPDQMKFVQAEIRKFAQHIYHYEQKEIGGMESGQQIDNNYGGKWNYTASDYISGFSNCTITPSKVNQSWVKIYIDLRLPVIYED